MAFTLTPEDLVLLKRLVNGQRAGESVTGVRDLDGTGNNLGNPLWGATDTPFLRLTPARYGDAILDPNTGATVNRDVNPIFAGLDPRTISNLVGDQAADTAVAASGVNMLFSAFGQYVDHGLDFLRKGGSGTLQIGAPGTGRTPGSDNPADLTRGSVSGFDANGVPIHDNQIPVFLDQNQTYGPTELVGLFLRETDGQGGVTARLADGGPDPTAPGFDLLPSLRGLILAHWDNDTRFVDGTFSTTFRTYYAGLVDDTDRIDEAMATALARDFMGTGQPLLRDVNPFISPLDHIVAGDGRVNENVTLTAVHTVWARNHNFHVENLLASGFTGTVEEVFQAAKLINEVEYQRIVLTDYTDALLGGMKGSGSHGHDKYNPGADPGISHEFAAAAFRFGHSLVSETVRIVGIDGQLIDVPLYDAFLNPGLDSQFTLPLGELARMGYEPQPGYRQYGANAILAGIEGQASEEIDVKVVDALRNDLTRISADLFSLNVARGRDLGLGTLNQVRQALASSTDPYVREAIEFAGNLRPYTSWQDFQSRNGLSDALIASLREAYPDLVLQTAEDIAEFTAANPDIRLIGGNTIQGIDRVDLWVGGLAERHINDGVVGQTFWVILHEQFDRLQEADRLYYTERVDNAAFYNLVDGGDLPGFFRPLSR